MLERRSASNSVPSFLNISYIYKSDYGGVAGSTRPAITRLWGFGEETFAFKWTWITSFLLKHQQADLRGFDSAVGVL